ncbi:MAG: hypothetical protein Q9227_007617 [Pyrenula ochraceoflavens]
MRTHTGFVSLSSHIKPPLGPTRRLCIKIPSTWAGLQACRVLESFEPRIHTLATTLFTPEQATLAGEAGCMYIAPYVNELKVHFQPGYEDLRPGFGLCRWAQRYFGRHGQRTETLAASLTSTDECLRLAGVKHITISEPLLKALAGTRASDLELEKPYKSSPEGQGGGLGESLEQVDWEGKEAEWHAAMKGRDQGEGERKMNEAIEIFCSFQRKLEDMVRTVQMEA